MEMTNSQFNKKHQRNEWQINNYTKTSYKEMTNSLININYRKMVESYCYWAWQNVLGQLPIVCHTKHSRII